MRNIIAQDKYLLIHLLGRGSFGEVFKAEYNPNKVIFEDESIYQNTDTSTDSNNNNPDTDTPIVKKKYMAIKRIRNEPKYHRAAQKEIRYLTELKINSKGDEPVVEMLDSFCSFGVQYIVFELLEYNLYEISQKVHIPYKKAVKIFYEVAKGLKFVHSRNLVHADLKPENIMLDNNFNNVKIIDFGSSFRYHPDEYRKNYYVQSRYYRAPEVCFNVKADYAIDMWSLGCIIYEVLFYKPLFPAKKDTFDLVYYYTIYLGLPLGMSLGSESYFYTREFSNYFKWNKKQDNYQLRYIHYNDFPPDRRGLIKKLIQKCDMCYPYIKTEPLRNMLPKLITYDFHKRLTAYELLQDPIFDCLS